MKNSLAHKLKQVPEWPGLTIATNSKLHDQIQYPLNVPCHYFPFLSAIFAINFIIGLISCHFLAIEIV